MELIIIIVNKYNLMNSTSIYILDMDFNIIYVIKCWHTILYCNMYMQ